MSQVCVAAVVNSGGSLTAPCWALACSNRDLSTALVYVAFAKNLARDSRQ